jgi:hypothetical protein
MSKVWGCAVAGLLFLIPVSVRADEEKVPLDKLPQAVAQAVKAKFPEAELVSASKEVDNGMTLFEISLKHKGYNYDATFTAEGKVVSIEKEIKASELPKEVAAALTKEYPKAEHKKIEEITADNKTTYEVLLKTTDGKLLEVVFDPQGKVVKTEKKDEKEKDKN